MMSIEYAQSRDLCWASMY
uniref:Uncharacterized protein n=1 Tax=Arundo donax TaxID=35708 RepID=A0A0A9C3G8_ARUDO